MNRAPRILLITLALSTITAPVVTPATPSTPCEALASLTLPNARIDSARMVAAGAFAAPGGARGGTSFATLPVFCRVTATLTPTSDSDIKTEFWLPASGWNGKFKAVGAGGWTGVIAYPALAAAVASGYAGAGNDTGYHLGGPAHVGPGHPEKLIDLGYRAMHEMTVQAKAVIKAHYGRAAKFSFYEGCSHGGRQGLAAAQMYPEDFNGIIAGAAGWDQMRVQSWRVALNLVVNRDAGSVIPPSKYSMIHEAALRACDGLDGVTDRVIENPATCRIDYTMLACKDGDSTDCLTSRQIESAKAMTSPLKDPKTGRVVFERHLMPGSEPGWAALAGPTPQASSVDILRTVVFADPSWDYHTMDLTIDFARAENADHGVVRSGDANLKPFFDRRGKLLMYHGWSDPLLSPMNSVAYYKNVLDTVGKDKSATSIALFMVPGMGHCGAGVGTDRFDKMKVIEEWVEQDRRPRSIIASHVTDGHVDKTRPLCPFGQVARYKGSGTTNEAANFACVSDTTPSASR